MLGRQEVLIHHPGAPLLNPDGTPQRDANDEPMYGPETTITEYGRVRPTSGRELTDGRQRSLVDAVGVLGPSSSVSEKDEVTAGGKRYRVLSVFLVESLSGSLTHTHVDLGAVS